MIATRETVVKAVGGQHVIDAVRALDRGDAPETVLRQLFAARLSPGLRAVYAVLVTDGATHGAIVSERLGVSHVVACNRLKELERRGIATVAGRANVPGGGAIKVYSLAGRESKEAVEK